MGVQHDARLLARRADALPATLYGHFTQAIYRNRPIDRHFIDGRINPGFLSYTASYDVASSICQAPPPCENPPRMILSAGTPSAMAASMREVT